MKTTKRDTTLTWTVSALSHLEVARHCRLQYTELLDASLAKWPMPAGRGHVSGIVNPAFPDDVKDKLRTYVELTQESIGHAVQCWQLAGRKISTLRPYLEAARELPFGRRAAY